MKNPLADPGITGISSGASLVTIIIMVFFPELNEFKSVVSFYRWKCCWYNGISNSIMIKFSLRIVLAGVAIMHYLHLWHP